MRALNRIEGQARRASPKDSASPRLTALILSAGPGLRGERAFLASGALIFIAGTAGTIYLCLSMAGGMPMPGGWIMSMAWMRMPGQTWLQAAGSFLGMWVVMMVAMMTPSLVPTLSRYRQSVRAVGETRLAPLTALVGAGYFLVWTVFGAAIYPAGVAAGAAVMRWAALARAVPVAGGVALLLAGCVQLTSWKARQLGCCRNEPHCESTMAASAPSAWRHGLRLGMHCVSCCSSFMMILLALGVMNLGAMTIATTAITVERLAPRPERVARAAGVIIIVAGIVVIARELTGV